MWDYFYLEIKKLRKNKLYETISKKLFRREPKLNQSLKFSGLNPRGDMNLSPLQKHSNKKLKVQ